MKTTAKSEETRARILKAAIELFARQGFDAATMRGVAAEAGVATGAAYYYFDSKDAIVLAFYDQSHKDMQPQLEQAVAAGKDLKPKLQALLEVKLEYFEPNRGLLGTLASHADPAHPLSPFSAQTAAIRERDMDYFARAVEAARVRIPADLLPYMPGILWMYQMGIILFWIYDRSPGQRRTRALIDKSLAVVVRLIRLAGFPLLRPVRRMVVELAETVQSAG